MKSLLRSLFSSLRRVFRSRTDLFLEVTALRQQLEVYQRQMPQPKLQRVDRLFWIWLCRHWAGWRSALVIMALRNRRVVHVAVTSSPTLDWVKQQVREATAWDEVPRFLLHDNDGIFGQYRVRERRGHRCNLDVWLESAMGIRGIPIPYGAPNAAAHIERFMGTLKRECLVHFIFVSEDHLRRTTHTFVSCYNERRPHQGIHGIPVLGPGVATGRAPPAESSCLVAEPILGGLHHHYRLAA